ncbi:MAG: hypothetical protein J6Y03_06045 [Alphaproteobacteria bacterium]|nr:hypothetical protein [Alphaproteobacteria bacterium]
MVEQIIHLENDFIKVGVSPACGAALSYFKIKNQKNFDVMRYTDSVALRKNDILSMSMFAMIPYPFSIKSGEFTYWGIKRLVPKTHPNFSYPIHGDGWRSKWVVEHQDATSVKLSLSHDKEKDKGYPFSYEASICYRLNGKSLEIEINLTNRALMPMPCGFGLHPFFNKTPDVTLTFDTKNVWYHQNDPIDRPYKTPSEWSFKDGKKLERAVFDTCFGGFDGNAKITWPQEKVALHIKSDEIFSHVALYSPNRKNFFCLEPATMTCDAFNIASRGIIGSGIQSIGKDETLTGCVSFTVEEL